MRCTAAVSRALLLVTGLSSTAVSSIASEPTVARLPEPEPAPLVWPTDAGRCVTSSFCEFRPGHFHSGIDISTRGRTGFRCFAVGDGELVRARVSCGGYGRALYLRLEDGRTAVYAHLARLEGAVAQSMREYQESEGTMYGDLTLSPGIPVRAGDVVGYTGQSGAGVPHLHFEIRDENERPLDPLTEGFPVKDASPPFVTRVALTPLTFVSSVDGRSDTVILDVHGEPPAGRIPRVIPVEGEIGIAIEVDESADECRFRLAPRRMSLHEGSELLFEVDYRGFAFSETKLMDTQIDPRFSYTKVGRFHNLWRRSGNDLPFSPGDWRADGMVRARQTPPEERPPVLPESPDEAVEAARGFPWRDSVQRPGEKTRKLSIVVEDAAGNRGMVDLQLSFAAPPTVSVMSVELVRQAEALREVDAELGAEWPDSVVVHGAYRPGGRAIRHIAFDYSLDAGQTWHLAPRVVPEADHTFHARLRMTQRVPGEGVRDVLVRARAVDVLGASGIARTVAPETSAPPGEVASPEFEIETLGAWFEVRFPETVCWSGLSGGWDDGAAVLVRPWGRGVRVVVPVATVGVRVWSGRGEEWKGYDPWGRPVGLRFAAPSRVTRGGEVTTDDGQASFRFPEDGFAEPTWVQVRREPSPSRDGELRSVAPLRFLESGQVPITAAYEVELVPDVADFDPDRLGIFVHEPDGFRYIGGEARKGGGRVTETRTPLGIGLFEDVTAPVLGEPRLGERHGRVRLTFLAEDDGCGIDCSDVEILFEGRSLLYELDDETGDVIAFPEFLAEPGAGGRFEIRATDRCGNTSQRVETVRLP
jgi:hypothetical protein